MGTNGKNLSRGGLALILFTLASLGFGCSTPPPRLPGFPEGDAQARRRAKKLAMAGFLVHYSFGPDINLATVFTPGTRYQRIVEYMSSFFTDELSRSSHFKLVPLSKVKENRFYRTMSIEPDPRSRLRSTCPAGYRKLSPRDQFDYRGLCNALGVDGLVLFEFSYSMLSSTFTRSARIHSANLLGLGSDGTILYRRSSLGQESGRQYFADYAWLRKRTFEQDIHCLDLAVRSVAWDFLDSFAPR
jgi:hypothetical protein